QSANPALKIDASFKVGKILFVVPSHSEDPRCPPVLEQLAGSVKSRAFYGPARDPRGQMSSPAVKSGKISAYAAVKVDPESDYCTPGAFDLERLFWKGSPKYTHVNEVWPSLYIGDE
ncbi:hypothetical protein Chor_013683, partial [Crotalus horridus]